MKLSDLIQDRDASQQKKKLIAIYAIVATLFVLVALIVALCVTSIVYKGAGDDVDTSTDTAEDEDDVISDGIPSGYIETTFDNAVLYSGSLILVNETYPVNAASTNTYIVLQNYSDRPKTPAGSNTYTVEDKASKATPAAADALNKLLGDYYKQYADDNLVISSADATSGMVFSFKYFVNFTF